MTTKGDLRREESKAKSQKRTLPPHPHNGKDGGQVHGETHHVVEMGWKKKFAIFLFAFFGVSLADVKDVHQSVRWKYPDRTTRTSVHYCHRVCHLSSFRSNFNVQTVALVFRSQQFRSLLCAWSAPTFLRHCEWRCVIASRLATTVHGKGKSCCVHITFWHSAPRTLRGLMVTEDIHLSQLNTSQGRESDPLERLQFVESSIDVLSGSLTRQQSIDVSDRLFAVDSCEKLVHRGRTRGDWTSQSIVEIILESVWTSEHLAVPNACFVVPRSLKQRMRLTLRRCPFLLLEGLSSIWKRNINTGHKDKTYSIAEISLTCVPTVWKSSVRRVRAQLVRGQLCQCVYILSEMNWHDMSVSSGWLRITLHWPE